MSDLAYGTADLTAPANEAAMDRVYSYCRDMLGMDL